MDATDQHWQMYLWAKPEAEKEIESLRSQFTPVTYQEDYKQYLSSDPTHPRAYIPPYVRWAKRSQVGFHCPITGWAESDWYRGIHGRGPWRRVGMLTMDHIIPGSAGGLTTDENIRAISMLANSKKGQKQVSDEVLRGALLQNYARIEMPKDLLEMLEKYGITSYKVGT